MDVLRALQNALWQGNTLPSCGSLVDGQFRKFRLLFHWHLGRILTLQDPDCHLGGIPAHLVLVDGESGGRSSGHGIWIGSDQRHLLRLRDLDYATDTGNHGVVVAHVERVHTSE